MIRAALVDVGGTLLADNLPLGDGEPFPGARELLEESRVLGLAVIAVTNSWSTREESEPRLREAGLEFDDIVSSEDVGWRKPHPAMFEAALAAAGCAAADCVFIGDSEGNDVMPALQCGMTVIRVAIQEPAPERSAAHHLVTDLAQARTILRDLAKEGGTSGAWRSVSGSRRSSSRPPGVR